MIRRPALTAILLLASPALAQAPAPAAKAPGTQVQDIQAPAGQAPQPGRATGTEAVIGVLNKRLSTTAEFRLKPGEKFAFDRLSGVMHACERTAPWETRQEQGAFVQLVESPPAMTRTEKPPAPRTIFSGWLFARSPSLNPVRHPVYDVWIKSCTMDFPDGPASESGSRSRTSGGSTPGTAGRGTDSAGG